MFALVLAPSINKVKDQMIRAIKNSLKLQLKYSVVENIKWKTTNLLFLLIAKNRY